MCLLLFKSPHCRILTRLIHKQILVMARSVSELRQMKLEDWQPCQYIFSWILLNHSVNPISSHTMICNHKQKVWDYQRLRSKSKVCSNAHEIEYWFFFHTCNINEHRITIYVLKEAVVIESPKMTFSGVFLELKAVTLVLASAVNGAWLLKHLLFVSSISLIDSWNLQLMGF